MNPEPAIYLAIAGIVMVVAAFLLGRRTSSSAARQHELEAELSAARREQSRAEAEAERLRNELDTARAEHDDYRLSVVDHFSGTSDLLRDLTVQYRSVYEHLTKGASTLCPEGFVGLTEGLPVPQIADAQPDLEVDSEDLEALASDPEAAPAEAKDEGEPDSESDSAPDDATEQVRPLST